MSLSSAHRTLAGLAGASLATVAAAWLAPRTFVAEVYGVWAYQTLWGALVLAGLHVSARWRATARSELPRVLAGPAAVAMALVLGLAISGMPQSRQPHEEALLLSTSLSMYQDQSARAIVEGIFAQGAFQPTAWLGAPPPPLVPFAVHLLHCFFGFNPEHAFVVSLLCAWGVLIGVFALAAPRLGRAGGYLAMLAAFVFPPFTLAAASGGAAMGQALGLTLVLLQSRRFLARPEPREAEALGLLAAGFAAAGDAALLLLLPLALAFLARRRRLLAAPLPATLALAPLLLLPVLWRLRLAGLSPDAGPWSGSWSPPFLASAFDAGGWLRSAAPSLTAGPWSLLLLWPAALAVGALGARLWRHPAGRPALLLALVALAVEGLSLSAMHDPGRMLAERHEAADTWGELQGYPHEGTLVVSRHPWLYTALRYGAISFATANAEAAQLDKDLRRGLYSNVLVMEELDAGSAVPAERLDPRLLLQPTALFRISRGVVLRVSHAVAPEPAGLPAGTAPGVAE